MKNLGNLMKQAQEMQTKMQEMQDKLAEVEISGRAGGGMVTITMDGRHNASKVKIKPSLLEEEVEMLEDLIAAAINSAVKEIEKESKKKISQLTAGMNIPQDLMGDKE